MPAERQVIGLGMPSPRDFLLMPGVVVSGHVGRNVSRVLFGDEPAYLKREHRVRLRDRLRSFLDGFGQASLSRREYLVIRRLRENGLPAPQLLANGEADGQAFLLLAQADGAVELNRLAEVDAKLAAELGYLVARIHNVGVDQPDLFTKHLLVNPETGQVTILDWQRATLRDAVPWGNRVRSLAAFRATCPESLLSPASWRQFLRSYADATNTTDLRRLSTEVEASARTLRQKPSIRSQLVPTAADQELVRIAGETVCAIPSIAREVELPDVIASLYDPANRGCQYRFGDSRTGTLQVSVYHNPTARVWSKARGKSWRSRELKAARLLFHLERYGIPAPKLLAYGQNVRHLWRAGAFVLAEPIDCEPATAAHAEHLRKLLNRLHATGCQLRRTGQRGEPFGIVAGTAVVREIGQLRLNRRLSARQMARDRARLDAFIEGRR